MGKLVEKSNEVILEAIKGSGGIVQTIADRLGVTWHTAKRLIDSNEETKLAYDAELECVLDEAESVVYHAIRNDKDIHTAKWLLSLKAKKRGFNDKHEVEHTGGISINVNFVDGDESK